MNVHHSSESNDHGSPSFIVEPARSLLGGISVDPASSATFNKVIRARKFYSLENPVTLRGSGYLQKWKGTVFLNPPGGLCEFETGRAVLQGTKTRKSCKESGACGIKPPHEHQGVTSSSKAWWYRMAESWNSGHTTAAFFVGFSLELLQSTQIEYPDGSHAPHLPHRFPRCYPKNRIPFLTEEDGELVPGEMPTHGNVLIYLPKLWSKTEQKKFFKLFEEIGECVWPHRKASR